MGSKFKPRQQRRPRSEMVVGMLLHTKGGPMNDRRDRRSKEYDTYDDFDDDDDEDYFRRR